jgi:hypothetical protein
VPIGKRRTRSSGSPSRPTVWTVNAIASRVVHGDSPGNNLSDPHGVASPRIHRDVWVKTMAGERSSRGQPRAAPGVTGSRVTLKGLRGAL